MSKKRILEDDSNLLKSVRQVIAKDTKPIVISEQRLKEKAKGDLNLAIRVVMLEVEQVTAIASQDSLRNYPDDNANTFQQHQDRDSRYGSKENQNSIKQEPNVPARGGTKEVQKQLISAARALADIYSRIIDGRARLSSSDIIASKRFVKDALGSLMGD